MISQNYDEITTVADRGYDPNAFQETYLEAIFDVLKYSKILWNKFFLLKDHVPLIL